MASNNFPAVIIHCDASVRERHQPRFQQTQVSRSHPVFKEPICDVSALVGLQIRIIQINTPNTEGRMNQLTIFLKMSLDPASEEFGFAPFGTPGASSDWQNSCGNVMVAKADGGGLATEDVRMLAEFSMYRLRSNLQECFEAELDPAEYVQNHITPEVFNWYKFETGERERQQRQ